MQTERGEHFEPSGEGAVEALLIRLASLDSFGLAVMAGRLGQRPLWLAVAVLGFGLTNHISTSNDAHRQGATSTLDGGRRPPRNVLLDPPGPGSELGRWVDVESEVAAMRPSGVSRRPGHRQRVFRRRPLHATAIVLAGAVIVACGPPVMDAEPTRDPPEEPIVRSLPEPSTPESGSLEDALAARRSARDLDPRVLSEAQVGQLLWAAQGVTDPSGLRAAPSAGASYPVEVYVVTAERVARYVPAAHALVDHLDGDHRRAVTDAAFDQDWMADAPLIVVFTAVEARTAERYGERAARYVLIEIGHAAQNLLLQATALDLVGTPVGAFEPTALTRALALPDEHVPIYLVPVGHPAT